MTGKHNLKDTIPTELKSGMPAILLEIPNNVPEELTLEDKEGSTTVVNGQEVYSLAFQRGWLEFWTRSKYDNVVLTDPHVEPDIIPEYGLESKGRYAGLRPVATALWGDQQINIESSNG